MNNFEKSETLKLLRKMHEKFGQEIAVERKNGALLRYSEIILDIIKNVKEIPAAEDCHECKDCKYLAREKRPDRRRICTKFDVFIFNETERPCLYGEKRIVENDNDDVVAGQCSECGNEVCLKWDVDRDGRTVYCPYCGYSMEVEQQDRGMQE